MDPFYAVYKNMIILLWEKIVSINCVTMVTFNKNVEEF